MNYRQIAEQIFLAGVERVIPDRLIEKAMFITGNLLRINDIEIDLTNSGDIYVIGAGKASALMGAAVEKILGHRITAGHIIVKYGHACSLGRITVSEAGHPVPDQNGFDATRSVMELCRRAGEKDLVICLLSGGGSALLADVPDGIDPEELMKLTRLLVLSGASITEINTVRKHLSEVKGGQLARAVYPASLVSLILSDVNGDRPDVIASGPTVPDPTTYQQARDILDKYNLTGEVSSGINDIIRQGIEGARPETPKPGDPVFSSTYNILVGNNMLALEAAAVKARAFGLEPFILTDRIEGQAASVADHIVTTAVQFQREGGRPGPQCLLFGGEPVVKVTGNGKGGRNQHLALLCAKLLEKHKGITVLSAGTDGNDGPTEAAGAVADCNTYTDALRLGIDPGSYISRYDSFTFFGKAGGHIITGPTRTNVMDIIVVIVE